MNSKSVSSLNSWSSSLSSWSEQQQIVSSYQFQILQPSIPEYTPLYNDFIQQDAQEYQGIQQSIRLKQNNSLSFFSGIQYHPKNLNVKYSRKVFIGGLPPDISENDIVSHFHRYGQLIVDWPHKSDSKSSFPPKGYAFLIFEKESSVQDLINFCVVDKEKYYIYISSPSSKDKAVQIRPWCLADADYLMDNSQPVDPRKTIFVGGVPRPLKASELAAIMNRLYGGVCYAGIDIDPELKYPKGAGRVSFSNHKSFVSAISARFVHLQHSDTEKRAEVKPYVLDDQVCDFCQGSKCNGRNASFFCANISCLQYFCEACWTPQHLKPGKDFHKPLIKEGADRPRIIPYKWC